MEELVADLIEGVASLGIAFALLAAVALAASLVVAIWWLARGR